MMDRITPLLHRLTGTSYADLTAAVGRLPVDQFARLDALAGEILDDARAATTRPTERITDSSSHTAGAATGAHRVR